MKILLFLVVLLCSCKPKMPEKAVIIEYQKFSINNPLDNDTTRFYKVIYLSDSTVRTIQSRSLLSKGDVILTLR